MELQEPLLYPDLKPAPLVTPTRAMVLKQAAETLRIMSGELVQRCQRDGAMFLPHLADALEVLMQDKPNAMDLARAEIRGWAALDRAEMSA